ncbi:MAG TPA: STT3 domain-containing protein, partial [Candidatus Nanoarchaeia archaeon]|nr:STT3 domain-containing protein [Candidatus Nanoarchaeia archaeon]
DFGRMKKWFSDDDKKEDQANAAEPSKEEKKNESDDEISIDLGSIKSKLSGMFKGEESSKEKGDDEISVDWGKVGSFFSKYGIFLLALIPLFLAVHVRMEAAGLPITDQWAQDTIFNGMRSQIASQIASQYPNLPQQNRDSLVNAEFQKQLEQNWPQIEQTIGFYSSEYKKYFQDDGGIPYMPDIDTYYWMRYAENVLDHGYAGDEMREGRQYDTLQLAPSGRYVFPDTFPSYFIAYFHRFLTFFNSQMTLVQSMSYYPVLIAALSTLLVFLIALKISNGMGALFAASMFAVNTSFLGRSLYGHADNDPWVLFFPLLITWLFFEMFERDRLWKVIAIGVLAGVSIGFFSIAWAGGWWFIFDLIGAMAVFSIGYLCIRDISKLMQQKLSFFRQRHIINLIAGIIVFVVVSGISVSYFRGPPQFFGAALGPLSFTTIKDAVTPGLWPNVLTTVAELNTGSFNQAIQSVGGKFMFYFGALGILLAFFKRDNQGRRDVRYTLLLGLWFIATCYATIKGIRFTLLLAPAFAVAFGTAIGMLYALFSRWLSKELHVHKAITSILLVLLFSLLLIGPVRTAYGIAGNDLPLVNDTWWHSLIAIKDGSKDNAIITSWWDFGHHFKEIAKRPVTFDGTTQTFPAAHWVGKLFMIDDEKKAAGILRMLDCSSGGNAFNLLDGKIQNPAKTIDVLDRIIVLGSDEALLKLKEQGFGEKAQEVIGNT